MSAKQLPEDLLEKIRHGENFQIEYKEAFEALPKNVYDTVSSFSNREGGDLFLGVHDCTVITGVKPKAVAQIINSFVTTVNNQDKINPALYLNATEYVYESDGNYSAVMKNGKTMYEAAGIHHIIHVHIPVAPTVVRNSNRIYDRNDDADIDITNFADQVFQCYARKQSSYFVNKVFPYFAVSDLRADLIERARKMAVNKKRLQEGKRHEWADMDDEELLRTSKIGRAHV